MKKWLTSLFIVSLMILQLCMTSYAAEKEETPLQDTSILQMVVLYTDAEGTEHAVQGGSGFLIGDEQSGAEYMITAKEVTAVSKETTQQVIELYAGENAEEKITYKTKAVVRRDVMIDVSLVAESDEMGFAVWKMSQPLYDREALVLYDEALTGVSGQRVSVLGFPTAPNLTEETIYYTKDEVITVNGMLIGDGKEENIKYLYHNIVPNPGMLGGPILNEKGYVVALNQSMEAQEGYYALQISELLPVLEALGIPYVTTGELEAQRQAELAAMVYKDKLQKGILVAQNIDGSLYYKKSYEAMKNCLTEAQAVNDSDDVTQQEVDYALANLNVAIAALEEKPPIWVTLVIVFFVIAIIAVIFTIIWMKTRARREQKRQKKLEELTVTQAPPVFEKKKVQKEDYRILVNQSSVQLSNEGSKQEEIYGETTVFRQDTGDTVVLRQEEKKQEAYLIRKRNGERITITEKEFVLGKDPSQTDYCLTGNSAISRAHAVILHKGTEYDVSDKNATNGTFVNGEKVAAFQKTRLKDGDIIRLADEDFEFRLDSEN